MKSAYDIDLSYYLILGLAILFLLFLVIFPVVAGETQDCNKNAEYIAFVTLERDKGRSQSELQSKDSHSNFIVEFVFSTFGRRFDGPYNYYAYFYTCSKFNGDINKIEEYMRGKLRPFTT